MAKKHKPEHKAEHAPAHKAGSGTIDDGKLFAFLGVFLTLLGFLIVYFGKKDNKYAMFYAKQGLVLFIAYVALWAIGWIPLIGWTIGILGSIFLLVLWVIGWINALSGKEKYIPVIGKYADKFDL
ncbi:MAG: hypothetical protein ABIA62_01370 [Candidatus Woesearchaeota archaeon]